MLIKTQGNLIQFCPVFFLYNLKYCGIYYAMKISYNFFRKYIANFIIILAIILVGAITYTGGVQKVFSSTNCKAIYSGNASNNAVSLMFNVYMGNEYVESILNTLDEKGVKATFFVGGTWVNNNEDCFSKIVKSGNEIGSHGYWHKDHDKISDDEQANEIVMTDELVSKISGIKMGLFAPPSGAYNSRTVEIADALGYKTIMWSLDTIDWRDKDENIILERASKAKAGDLILMHPTECTAGVLYKIIDNILNKGLKIMTVSGNLL